MNIQQQYQNISRSPSPPDASSVLLALAHGPFISSTITAAAVAVATAVFSNEKWKSLAIGWSAISIVLICWAFYAVYKSWRASLLQTTIQVFPTTGFILLFIVILSVLAMTLWTIIDISTETLDADVVVQM